MNITSLIAKGYVYQDLFSEDGYARNGEFNILHLDRMVVLGHTNFHHSQNL